MQASVSSILFDGRGRAVGRCAVMLVLVVLLCVAC